MGASAQHIQGRPKGQQEAVAGLAPGTPPSPSPPLPCFLVQPGLAVTSPQSPLREVAARLQASDCLPVVDDHFRVRQPGQVAPLMPRASSSCWQGRTDGCCSRAGRLAAKDGSGVGAQHSCPAGRLHEIVRMRNITAWRPPPALCSWWGCCLSAMCASQAPLWR